MSLKNSNEVPKPYFGKYQPDLFFIFTTNKTPTIESQNQFHNDILVQFKNKIDDVLKFSTFMISGKVRFSIRGFFYTGDKNWFIPNDNGPHLLTCVWSRDSEFGIDATGCLEKILFETKKYSNSGNTSYSYIITMMDIEDLNNRRENIEDGEEKESRSNKY